MAWIQWDTERDYSQTEYGKNTPVVGVGGDGENLWAMLIQGDDVRLESDGFERVESNDWRRKIERGFRRIQSDTTVRQNMGWTLWSLGMEVIVKILGCWFKATMCEGWIWEGRK
jgi:hypothetical protein